MTATSQIVQNTFGLTTAQAIQNTYGLQANINQDPTTNVQYIQPAAMPAVTNAPGNLRTALLNQLATQISKLFQELFPITADPDTQANDITNDNVLFNNQSILLNDVQQIKMTILTINQITTTPNRIPANFQTPNSDPASTAGLSLPGNNNPILNTCDQLWRDINDNAYQSAQLDYGTLRNQLRPILGL